MARCSVPRSHVPPRVPRFRPISDGPEPSLRFKVCFASVVVRPCLDFESGGMTPPFNIVITIKLNEVFKMLCEFACWGLVTDRGGYVSAALHSRSSCRQKFRFGQTDRWSERSCRRLPGCRLFP